MTEQPERPVALTVQPDNIPAELKVLPIWCCWRYEWNGKRWTKVPYTPFTTSKASSTRASSWVRFQAAYACYEARRDFFDGVFLALRDEDPYTGGDFDHSTDLEKVPNTYAEYSPSGNGVRFIGIGSVPSACTKSQGELYCTKRFLSITGHKLPSKPTDILPIQPALDVLYEELKPAPREMREGVAGSGNRAARAAAIPDDVWEAGRKERRTNINWNLYCLRKSAVSRKTQKDDTQLGYLLREDYRGFHEKWPYAGIIKGDGSIDQSQIRAIMASSIKMRGFSFPEYVSLMSYFFGVECVKKWGTAARVREEFASLWFRARSPRADDVVPVPAPVVKRGKGSDHAALLDRAYAALLDYRAGTDALLTTQELAAAIGIHRRTAITLLQELRTAGRIDYKQFRQHGGIIVSFPGVINEENTSGDLPHNEHSNGHNPNRKISAEGKNEPHVSGVINGNDESGTGSAENSIIDEAISADTEAVPANPGVINEVDDDPFLASPESGAASLITPDDECGSEAPYIYIYNQYCVSSPVLITPEKRVSLADAVSSAFDELPRDRVLDNGELKRWPVTAQRVIAHVQEHYADQGWKSEAIRYWVGKIRKRRRSQPFDELRGMRREELEARAASARKRIETAERKAVTAPMPELREWYAKEAARLSGYQALLAWEQGERDAKDAARIEKDGYSAGEQREMLDIVEREYRPAAKHARTTSVSPPTADVSGLVARLKARKVDD